MHFLKNTFSRVNGNTAENNAFLKGKKVENRPGSAGIAGNRFAITLLGNLTHFYNFIMFLTYFLKNLFKKESCVCFYSKQHGMELYSKLKT